MRWSASHWHSRGNHPPRRRKFSAVLEEKKEQTNMVLVKINDPFHAYQANERSKEHPAELPPDARSIADHVFDVLVEPFSSCGVKKEKKMEKMARRVKTTDWFSLFSGSHRKTKLWRLFRRRRGRADTCRWRSSNQRVWTRTGLPGRFEHTHTVAAY